MSESVGFQKTWSTVWMRDHKEWRLSSLKWDQEASAVTEYWVPVQVDDGLTAELKKAIGPASSETPENKRDAVETGCAEPAAPGGSEETPAETTGDMDADVGTHDVMQDE